MTAVGLVVFRMASGHVAWSGTLERYHREKPSRLTLSLTPPSAARSPRACGSISVAFVQTVTVMSSERASWTMPTRSGCANGSPPVSVRRDTRA